VESWLGRAKSPRQFLSSLRSKGIDRDDAEAALKAALDPETEQALLGRFAAKQRRLRRGAAGSDAGNALRSLKFTLKSEGFSPAVIKRFFDALEDETP
jgi:SOS response regulatory protein OraA/RecX